MYQVRTIYRHEKNTFFKCAALSRTWLLTIPIVLPSPGLKFIVHRRSTIIADSAELGYRKRSDHV